MKTQPTRRKDGFTLVELLVVIAIIAVLAGAGFAAGNAAIQKAKRTTALATCTAIEQAVNTYYSEYNGPPVADLAADTTMKTESSDTKGKDLLKVLVGLEGNVATPLNPRNIKCLTVKQGKKKGTGGIDGAIYDAAGTSIEGLYDPWGGPFYVMLDGDYDEILMPSNSNVGGVNLNGRKSVAWSQGADGVSGEGKPADDVKTW